MVLFTLVRKPLFELLKMGTPLAPLERVIVPPPVRVTAPLKVITTLLEVETLRTMVPELEMIPAATKVTLALMVIVLPASM